jgi:hypothetical protein
MPESRQIVVILPREVTQTIRKLDNLGCHFAKSDTYDCNIYPPDSELPWSQGS